MLLQQSLAYIASVQPPTRLHVYIGSNIIARAAGWVSHGQCYAKILKMQILAAGTCTAEC